MNEDELKFYVFWIEQKANNYLIPYFAFAKDIGDAIRMALAYESHENYIETNEDYKLRVDIDPKNVQEIEIVPGQVELVTRKIKPKNKKRGD